MMPMLDESGESEKLMIDDDADETATIAPGIDKEVGGNVQGWSRFPFRLDHSFHLRSFHRGERLILEVYGIHSLPRASRDAFSHVARKPPPRPFSKPA
jgi:hypothetical protein